MEEPRWTQLLNFWEIPGAVLLSFTAHLFIMLLASIRRHKASGAGMLILWLAYQLANWVAPYALNNISPCGKTMSRRQQLLAFWATFLLHNLGSPDNMSAFSMDDNALYMREALLALSRVVGASYVLYKHLYPGSGAGALIPASIIVLVVGAAKYAERVCALRQGDLGNIRGSSKKKQASRFFTACGGLDSGSLIRKGKDNQLDDEEALIVAHGMLRFCKRAMADSSVNTESPDEGAMADSSINTDSPENNYDLDTSRKILDMKWKNMCSVVEMELSLMYDILYTKAGVIHTSTGVGYIIRIASPLAIVAATVLFGVYYNKEGQSLPDVIITYILLLATLLLDTRWLLRALGSTWTHAFLQTSGPWRCLRHAVLCSGRWLRLRHFIVSLDLGRLRLTGSARSPSSYRRWSGTTGKYSMLQECTGKISACSKAAKALGLENIWKEHQHSRGGRKLSDDVKEAVFTRVRKVLRSTYEEDKDDSYSMKDITTFWGQVTKERYTKNNVPKGEQEEFKLGFGREFQEDILVWHIATKIFLVHSEKKRTLADAIVALSEHLMFLMAVHPDMLPGLALRSLYDATLTSLQEVSVKANIGSNRTTGEEKLAKILVNKDKGQWGFDGKKTRLLVKDGANIAAVLLNHADNSNMQELLELVFNIWVDKLLYAGTRCSRESHARQLGRGGDLTTIVWIMAEHAGPFRTGEDGPDVDGDEMPADEKQRAEKKKPDEKKRDEKKSEEKRKADEKKDGDKCEPNAEWSPYLPQFPFYPTYGGLPMFPQIPEDQQAFGGAWADQPTPDRPAVAAPTPPKPPKGRRRRYATLYPV